jgi:hypothetical protein
MNIRNVIQRERNKNLTAKYFYAKMDKHVEHQGETVDEFIARGGIVRQIKKETVILSRDDKGRYLKKNANQ